MGLGECDCPESVLLRELVTMLDAPDQMLNRLASSLAVWKLRSMSHELSAAGDWTRVHLGWSQRQEYDTPGRSPEEIRADTARSWAEFDQGRGPLWPKERT
jgi:hypothetical protein